MRTFLKLSAMFCLCVAMTTNADARDKNRTTTKQINDNTSYTLYHVVRRNVETNQNTNRIRIDATIDDLETKKVEEIPTEKVDSTHSLYSQNDQSVDFLEIENYQVEEINEVDSESQILLPENAQSSVNFTDNSPRSNPVMMDGRFEENTRNSSKNRRTRTGVSDQRTNLTNGDIKQFQVIQTSGRSQGRNPGRNWAAITGFVTALVSLLVFPAVLGPMAIVFSALGMNSERRGLAIAGLVIGIVSLAYVAYLVAML